MAEDPQQETINLLTYRLNAVTEQRDRLAEAIRNHKETLPFAPPPCDKKLYEALAAVKGGSEKPATLIHNGVGIASMYPPGELEKELKSNTCLR